ncbi:MAG: hydroxymethylglutaryl-CoA reductase, degradative [Candidatus Aenigmarchaeota archaeon]|nr:hydroxymethylglutaryl-CoA reductase, degradative [Candidatus Aenigmarchaeota archaeon]
MDWKKFRDLPIEERLRYVQEKCGLSDEEVRMLRGGFLDEDTANHMIENVIGSIKLPIGIATNFVVNGKEYLIPMAIEESSVVAAASNAAKLCRGSGGFAAEADDSIMIGQIFIRDFDSRATDRIIAEKDRIRREANPADSTLVASGGGMEDLEVREVGDRLCVHLLIDVKDAMGANFVNSTVERVAPLLEEITGGKVVLKILSNLAVYRKVRAKAVWDKGFLEESFKESGDYKAEDIVNGIIELWNIAKEDPYRRATHNKGMMNGIDALMIATGNDWRAIESGVHAYSMLTGGLLTRFSATAEGNLEGFIEIPLAAGIVGGATKINPVAQVCLKILGVKSAKELACVAASVGLANNFAALRVLSTEGVQRGHMKLHATNIAHMAGANGRNIERVAQIMIQEKKISVARAKEILEEII